MYVLGKSILRWCAAKKHKLEHMCMVVRTPAAAAAGTPEGDVQVLLTLAKALDPTGLPYTENRENNRSTFRLPRG
jgi:hypothetical protein